MKQRIIGFTLALALLLFGLSAGVQAQVTQYSATASAQLVATTVKVVCVAGVIMDASTNAGSVIIKSGTSTGTTILTFKDLATDNGQTKVFEVPGGYVWVQNGLYATLANCTNVDVLTVVPDGTKRVKLTYSGTAKTYRDNWIRDGRGNPDKYVVSSGDTITCSDAFAYSRLTDSTDYAYWALADF